MKHTGKKRILFHPFGKVLVIFGKITQGNYPGQMRLFYQVPSIVICMGIEREVCQHLFPWLVECIVTSISDWRLYIFAFIFQIESHPSLQGLLAQGLHFRPDLNCHGIPSQLYRRSPVFKASMLNILLYQRHP